VLGAPYQESHNCLINSGPSTDWRNQRIFVTLMNSSRGAKVEL